MLTVIKRYNNEVGLVMDDSTILNAVVQHFYDSSKHTASILLADFIIFCSSYGQ